MKLKGKLWSFSFVVPGRDGTDTMLVVVRARNRKQAHKRARIVASMWMEQTGKIDIVQLGLTEPERKPPVALNIPLVEE